MKIKKTISMSIHISPRDTQELTPDEQKQLADFFLALMDLDENKNVAKGYFDAKPNQ
jgi:hypothetical protein